MLDSATALAGFAAEKRLCLVDWCWAVPVMPDVAGFRDYLRQKYRTEETP